MTGNIRRSHRCRMDRIGRRIADDGRRNMFRIVLRLNAVGECQHRAEHYERAATSFHGWDYIANRSCRNQAIALKIPRSGHVECNSDISATITSQMSRGNLRVTA
jgi:hypothetical protein